MEKKIKIVEMEMKSNARKIVRARSAYPADYPPDFFSAGFLIYPADNFPLDLTFFVAFGAQNLYTKPSKSCT